MKRFLPIVLFVFFSFFFFHRPVFATSHETTPTPTPTIEATGEWVVDNEVTFVGKSADRADEFLNWSLGNYNWLQAPVNKNPLIPFWVTIRNIVYAILMLFLLGAAFVIIITRGRSIVARRLIPRFIFIILLITFSFPMVQFFFQVTDAMQGFFLRNPDYNYSDPASNPPDLPRNISSANLLSVAFDYVNFVGYSKTGIENQESKSITLLLVRLTAITYYVMTGLLIIRKIILWFFIVLSPVFPLLLFFSPVRNTAKIWIGEFFRWLLYGPLFAIFLSGLVSIWRFNTGTGAGIPLNFTFEPDKIIYPTAVNILIGGPGQQLGINNSVNYNDTFALYVVALMMLWVVILLPFLLLKIFLDNYYKFSFSESTFFKQLITSGTAFINRGTPPTPSSTPPPGLVGGAGLAKVLPFASKIAIPKGAGVAMQPPREVPRPTVAYQTTPLARPTQAARLTAETEKSEVFQFSTLAVPTMRDIARFETATLSKSVVSHQEVAQMHETLEKIANPRLLAAPVERQQYTQLRERLVQASQKGDVLANSIISAANVTVTTPRSEILAKEATSSDQLSRVQSLIEKLSHTERVSSTIERERLETIREKLVKESSAGNQLATSVLGTVEGRQGISTYQTALVTQQLFEASQKGEPVAAAVIAAANVQAEHAQAVQGLLDHIASAQLLSDQSKKEEYQTLKNQLRQEGAGGNTLAASVLATIERIETEKATGIAPTEKKSETNDIETATMVTEALLEARESGDTVATKLLELANIGPEVISRKRQRKAGVGEAAAGLPSVNRVQTVSIEDYEAVKKMWLENYKKLEPPKSFGEGEMDRKAWVRGDMDKITNAINLIMSEDPAKIAQGMGSVQSILPFLLIGGFSQDEVVAYLKAKLEAAKAVYQEFEEREKEEEGLLNKEQAVSKPQEQHMAMETGVVQPYPTSISLPPQEEKEPSVGQQITMKNVSGRQHEYKIPTLNVANLKANVIHADVLQIANITVPTLQDIVKFEKAAVSRSPVELQEVQTTQEALEKIVNPKRITTPTEETQFTQLREKLAQAKDAGDPLAVSVVKAALTVLTKPFEKREKEPEIIDKQSQIKQVQEIIHKLASPESITDPSEKKVYETLKARIDEENTKGNQTASIVKHTITEIYRNGREEAQQPLIAVLVENLHKQKELFDPLAGVILDMATLEATLGAMKDASSSKLKILALSQNDMPLLPQTNQVQTVSIDDYETVKRMWAENYRKLTPPSATDGKPLERRRWLEDDVMKITEIINLILSADLQKANKGMQAVGEILPFLLIGGFSRDEVVSYLKAKQEAAKLVLDEIGKQEHEEESLLHVQKQEEKQNVQEMALEENPVFSHNDGTIQSKSPEEKKSE